LSTVYGDGFAKFESLQSFGSTEDNIGYAAAPGIAEHLRGDFPYPEKLGLGHCAREPADTDYERVPIGSAFIGNSSPDLEHLLGKLPLDTSARNIEAEVIGCGLAGQRDRHDEASLGTGQKALHTTQR